MTTFLAPRKKSSPKLKSRYKSAQSPLAAKFSLTFFGRSPWHFLQKLQKAVGFSFFLGKRKKEKEHKGWLSTSYGSGVRQSRTPSLYALILVVDLFFNLYVRFEIRFIDFLGLQWYNFLQGVNIDTPVFREPTRPNNHNLKIELTEPIMFLHYRLLLFWSVAYEKQEVYI